MCSWKQSKRDRFISFKELLPRILVKDPVTHDSWNKGKFTTYLICIKTEHPAFHLRLSAVRRRFSELRWLYRMIRANHPHINFPNPPSKKVFAERFEPEFIKSRMSEIQEFLNHLLVTDTVLSDAAFHFFVQTDLTPDEIEEYLNGTLSESIVQEAWGNAGHLHSSSYIVNTTTIPHEPQEIFMNEEDLQLNHQTSHLDSSDSSFYNSTSFVPQDGGAQPVSKDDSTFSMPHADSAQFVPEVSSTPVPEDNSAFFMPQAGSAQFLPEVSGTHPVSEDDGASSVPETNSSVSVSESSSEVNTIEILPMPESKDVILKTPVPPVSISDELVDLTNQKEVVSSCTDAMTNCDDTCHQECPSELEDISHNDEA